MKSPKFLPCSCSCKTPGHQYQVGYYMPSSPLQVELFPAGSSLDPEVAADDAARLGLSLSARLERKGYNLEYFAGKKSFFDKYDFFVM